MSRSRPCSVVAVEARTTVRDCRKPCGVFLSATGINVAGPQTGSVVGTAGPVTPSFVALRLKVNALTPSGVQPLTATDAVQTETPNVQLPFASPSASHAGSPS